MNFLYRTTTTQHVERENVCPPESPAETHYPPRPSSTLEGLIVEDPFPQSPMAESRDVETDGVGGVDGSFGGSSEKICPEIMEKNLVVSDDEGWITIPYRELPRDWNHIPDIHSLRSLDRPFVFPGEQVHILACLSASKQDTEIITPFKVAALISKSGMGQSHEQHGGNVKDRCDTVSGEGEVRSDHHVIDQNGNDSSELKIDPQKDISASESFLRMEDRKRQTETLLQRFKSSYFFVRISESGEPLWSRKMESDLESAKMDSHDSKTANKTSDLNTLIDRGNFDANISGGAARSTVNCYSLSNGDIVVLLQVNVGVNSLRDPTIEIIQFEKYQEKNPSSENQDTVNFNNYDPCRELLKWLLPVDNNLPPPSRTNTPPRLSSSSGVGGTPQKPASSGTQLFSHFRSYSMSSLPQSIAPPIQPVKTQSSKPRFDIDDWDQYSSQKFWKNRKSVPAGLLSFRGVPLERERFSVRCGLEGIHIPGRMWRRKIEIIQPVEIHSFAADCNTDDLLCVQIKNVSPARTPDIVVYIDAISIVFDEASNSGPPSSLPIACIEAGNDHCLPNLALRRGEEHSFILKPATSMWKNSKVHSQRASQSLGLYIASNTIEGRRRASNTNQYAVMVSCRCNYTESRLFFKQPTTWRPRISRDIMISVASEMSGQSCGPSNGRVSQLPVQVLTLQASNMTSEDLNMTVLAPASFNSFPSVVSLSSSPMASTSQFVSLSKSTGKMNGDRNAMGLPKLNSSPALLGTVSTLSMSENQKQDDNRFQPVSFNQMSSHVSNVIPNTGVGCTHLWLQSRVPLGCVPAQSMATIKLELLPLTDGIITLDTLQVDVKEKGLTYIPEHSLQINATSSISTGITRWI